jgi:hypothetical protein
MDCSGGFLKNLWSGNAIVCSDTFQQSQVKSGQAQIQSVVDNAAEFYGPNSPAVIAGQASADQQKSSFVNDVLGIDADVINSDDGKTCDDGAPGINLSILGLPCLKYSWFKWGAVAVVALLVLYVVALGRSFLPRG